ncbi:hypothetical protein V1520DRAFT_353242 [Lipomyces starkeyi]
MPVTWADRTAKQYLNDDWTSEFWARPNSKVEEVDVLITTSVLQAGHSLDRCFRVSFDFIFRGVLSFRAELQFTSRLRYFGRDDMVSSGGYRLAESIPVELDNAGARWGDEFTNTVKASTYP